MEQLPGKIFKVIRESKNMSLKEVADEDISVAQLSRYERGISGMTVDAFYRCLKTMSVSLDEFEYVFNNYSQPDDLVFSTSLADAYLSNNVLKLEKMFKTCQKLEKEHPNKKNYRLNRIVVRAVLSYCEDSIKVSKKDIEFLTDYLFSVEEWGRYELWLFTNSVGLLTVATLETFASEMISRTQFYHKLPENRKRILQMLLDVVNVCIEQDHLQVAMKFLNYIDNTNIPETDLYERILTKYHKAYYLFKAGKSTALEDMKECLNILEYLECYGAGQKLKRQIADLEVQVADSQKK
ncbi:Rgg/GadR/MutR family transcriptional regulator [Streptococcus oricebi]|uniref:XRE family transcriptional regulator n=1 Tax=Streptococcus oricebi TaxID=1547447 RepID=A0ABS5B1P4_9STRE|nr:Rgg/GadR/MutR family transcriptional regulator [Streptococcus oricebi]MBP2622756.1 XRE family transcriptional regulator [Streptococcus oricebi]